MLDQAPDSPIEPTAAQLQASGANNGSTSAQQQQANGKNSDATLAKYGLPGSSWTSKKFLEDYDVAVQKLCHQDFDPGMYMLRSGGGWDRGVVGVCAETTS